MWPLHQEHAPTYLNITSRIRNTMCCSVVQSGRKGRPFFPPPWQALPVCARCQHAPLADVDFPCTTGSISLDRLHIPQGFRGTSDDIPTEPTPMTNPPMTSYHPPRPIKLLERPAPNAKRRKTRGHPDDLRLCLPGSMADGFSWDYG